MSFPTWKLTTAYYWQQLQNTLGTLFLSCGTLCIVLGLSSGTWRLWSTSGTIITPAGRVTAVAGALCLGIGFLQTLWIRRQLPKIRDFAHPIIWTLGLVTIFFSDWLVRPWSLYQGPSIRGELIWGGLFSYFFFRTRWQSYSILLPLLSAGLLFWSFLLTADGRLLFSDDHAMFIFRLKMLVNNFPNIPFWSPLWNSGFDARDYFATGALNFFLLFSPILYSFSIEAVYPYLVATLLWICLPCSLYASARLLYFPKASSFITATIGLSTGLFWYRWSLKYGTLGFITSASLFPLVAVTWHTFIRATRPSIRLMTLVITSTTLMCLWSPAALAILPMGIFVFLALPKLMRSKRHILTFVILLALNLPWMTMMWKVSSVGKFLNVSVANETSSASLSSSFTDMAGNSTKSKLAFRHSAGSFNLKRALHEWQNNATSLNPLIVIFGLPSILLLHRRERLLFGIVTTWLFFLGTILVPIKPQLELDRMLVMAAILLCVPIGRSITTIFLQAKRSSIHRFSAAIVGGFLLVGPLSTTAVVLNRSEEKYSFLDPKTDTFIDLLEESNANGRLLFTGCVLHELSGGHLAPLPLWTDIEMIATSYAHNIWTYTQPFPSEVLEGGIPAIEQYLHARNVSIISAHEPVWIALLKKNAHLYQAMGRHGKFEIFRRLQYKPNLVVKGMLRDFKRTHNSISFIPTTSSVTLNYEYFPFLQSTAGSIKQATGAFGLSYFTVSGYRPGERITISSVSPLKRLTM